MNCPRWPKLRGRTASSDWPWPKRGTRPRAESLRAASNRSSHPSAAVQDSNSRSICVGYQSCGFFKVISLIFKVSLPQASRPFEHVQQQQFQASKLIYNNGEGRNSPYCCCIFNFLWGLQTNANYSLKKVIGLFSPQNSIQRHFLITDSEAVLCAFFAAFHARPALRVDELDRGCQSAEAASAAADSRERAESDDDDKILLFASHHNNNK
jgi:hypothetical protein